MHDVDDIRWLLAEKLQLNELVGDKSGSRTIEIIGESFEANEDSLFGEVNWDYVERELEWYESMSLSVNDIPGAVPQIWKQVASREGKINSNYGWCVFSPENHNQYRNAIEELRSNPESRRAAMIYNRPSMWLDFDRDGMSDFMCCYAMQFLLRGGVLNLHVSFRSNDAVFGYKNDRAWADHLLTKASAELGVKKGKILWCAASLHVYERHFYLVDHWDHTGEKTITKKEYAERYPDSEWAR